MAEQLGVVDRPLWALSDAELGFELDRIFAAEQALAARRLELVREIDGRGLAIRDGATSAVAWLRDRLRVSGRAARRMLDLARSLSLRAPLGRCAIAP